MPGPRAGRAPATAAKLQGVDATRGLAALLVVLLHASAMLSSPKDFGVLAFGGLLQFGRAGVDYFFVLSGFVIAWIHTKDAGRPAAFAPFWFKRLWRIYPVWWMALGLYLALLVVSPSPDRRESDVWYVVNSIFLIPERYGEPILVAGWSLRHEMLFYLLFGVAIIHRRLGMAVMALWAAGLIGCAAWATAYGAPYFPDLPWRFVFRVFNAQFFFGMAVAALLLRGWRGAAWPCLITGSAGFLIVGMVESFGPLLPHEYPPLHLAYALFGAMFLYGVAATDLLSAEHGRPRVVPLWLRELGAASYSIYLMQWVGLLFMQQLLRALRPIVAIPLETCFLLLVTAAVSGGIVFSRWVERPLLRAGRAWMARRPAIGPAQRIL